jgi:hypothetical protein
MFRQTIERFALSIEEGTANVPDDGRYYVIEDGVTGKGYRSLRDAIASYEKRKAQRLEREYTDSTIHGVAPDREAAPASDGEHAADQQPTTNG